LIQYYPIKLLKMVTGEQVISGIAESGESNYILERPMSVVSIPVRKRHPNGKEGVQEGFTLVLKDWIDFTMDDYIMVPKQSVVCITTPIKELVGDYQMAKINSDMEGELEDAPDVLEEDYKEDEEGDEDEEDNPEFPGWGGDPRLGP
jgi:hypothetical protein